MKNYKTLLNIFTKYGTHAILPVKSFYLEPDEIGYKPFVYIRDLEDPVYIPRIHTKMILDMMTDGITCHEIDNRQVYMYLKGIEEIHDKIYFDIAFKKMDDYHYLKWKLNSAYGKMSINPYQE